MIAGLHKSMFSLVGNHQVDFVHDFAFPPAKYESSCHSTSSSAFSIASVQDFGHANKCAAIFHCCFTLDFPDKISCEIAAEPLKNIFASNEFCFV